MGKKKPHVYLTVADVEDIADMYLKGSKLVDIAKHYKVDYFRIRNIIAEKRLFRRGFRTVDIVTRNKEIVRRYSRGESLDFLAAEYKISRERVYKIIFKEAFHLIIHKPKIKDKINA